MLQKIALSRGGPTPDPRQEHVINVIERPSQMKISSPSQHPHTSPVIPQNTPVIPHRPVRSHHLHPAPTVAASGDINQQLVERIQELYRQLQQTPESVAPTTV